MNVLSIIRGPNWTFTICPDLREKIDFFLLLLLLLLNNDEQFSEPARALVSIWWWAAILPLLLLLLLLLWRLLLLLLLLLLVHDVGIVFNHVLEIGIVLQLGRDGGAGQELLLLLQLLQQQLWRGLLLGREHHLVKACHAGRDRGRRRKRLKKEGGGS